MAQLRKILIIGIDSKLGSLAANRLTAQAYKVYGTTRRETSVTKNIQYLNLEDRPEKWPRFPNCDTALICASVPSVDECENNPEKTKQLNVDSICNLASSLINKQCLVLFPSTNMVFNGHIPFTSTNHQTSPTTVYASQKVMVERFLAEKSDSTAIIRFTKILDERHYLFLKWMADLKQGKEIKSYSDKIFSPISIDFAVDALTQIVRKKTKGIFHLSGSADISYSDAARHIAYRLNKETSLIIEEKEKKLSDEKSVAARYSTLEQSDIFKELDHPTDPYEVMDYVFDWHNGP